MWNLRDVQILGWMFRQLFRATYMWNLFYLRGVWDRERRELIVLIDFSVALLLGRTHKITKGKRGSRITWT